MAPAVGNIHGAILLKPEGGKEARLKGGGLGVEIARSSAISIWSESDNMIC
jgi:hypothetical protein